MLNVAIIGVTQTFSFESKTMRNFLNLKLPNGASVSVEVAEDVLGTVTQAFAEVGVLSEQKPSAAHEDLMPSSPDELVTDNHQFKQVKQEEQNDEVVFGGDLAGALPFQSPPQEKPVLAERVVKDAYGYPVISGAGAVDPQSLIGGSSDSADEDGVGQL